MKKAGKMIVDVAMTVALLLLMSYELIGQQNHEIIGCVMMALFLVHHWLNRRWIAAMFRGKYTTYRTVQTILVAANLVCMVTQAVSGVVLSRSLFLWLEIHSGQDIARIAHILGAYWGFALMGVHLGLHRNTMMTAMHMKDKKWLPIVGHLFAAYGLFAFFRRGIGGYMLLLNQFVFFDRSELFVFFLLDYVAAMGMFVWVGNYLAKSLRRKPKEAI